MKYPLRPCISPTPSQKKMAEQDFEALDECIFRDAINRALMAHKELKEDIELRKTDPEAYNKRYQYRRATGPKPYTLEYIMEKQEKEYTATFGEQFLNAAVPEAIIQEHLVEVMRNRYITFKLPNNAYVNISNAEDGTIVRIVRHFKEDQEDEDEDNKGLDFQAYDWPKDCSESRLNENRSARFGVSPICDEKALSKEEIERRFWIMVFGRAYDCKWWKCSGYNTWLK